MGAFRLLLFADPRSASSVALQRAAIRAARQLGIEVVAVVDAAGTPMRAARHLRRLAGRWMRRLSEPGGPLLELDRGPLIGWSAPARCHRAPVLVPPDRDVNNPRFVRRVEDELRPDAALTLMVSQIFGRPLLEACGRPVNYHNGLLPAYRGLGATAWSVYNGEARSGFSLHRMTEGVDEGEVLLSDAVSLQPGDSTAAVEERKTGRAVSSMATILARLTDDEPGAPQRGEARSYTAADRAEIRTVGDPSRLEWPELERRLLAFELLDLGLAGGMLPVTRLERAGGRPHRPELCFHTADGVLVEASRVRHLPPALHRAYSALGWSG